MRRRELYLPVSASRQGGLKRRGRLLLWFVIWSLVAFAMMYGPLDQGMSAASVIVAVVSGLAMATLLQRALVSRRARRQWQVRFIWPARLLLLYLVLIVVAQLYSTGAVPTVVRNYAYQFDRLADAITVHSPGLDELPARWHELYRLYRNRAGQAGSDAEFLAVVDEWLVQLDEVLLPGVATVVEPSHGREPARAKLWARVFGGSVYAATAGQPGDATVWAERLPAGIGYMRITSLVEGADVIRRFDEALTELGDVTALVIDVRRAGGSNRKSAEQIAGRFLADSFAYGSVSFRHRLPHFGWVKSITYTAEPRGETFSGAVVLLTDAATSGAAELLVVALQASGRALVVGERTAGMLHVPIAFQLPGGKVHLPVGKFQPATGVLEPKAGVGPDLAVTAAVTELGGDEDVVLAAAIDYLIQQP